MLRITVVAMALTLLTGAASADAKVRCGSGTTAFVEGKLRIFGVHYSTPDEFGFDEYACLGRKRRPVSVGQRGATTGTGSSDTPAFAVGGGGRYLASYAFTDGEGGPSASIKVIDLRTRRTVAFIGVACCEGVPAFRVASDGTLVVLSAGEDLVVKAPGQRARTLSTRGAVPKDLAMVGNTVYWSEGGQAQSATLTGSVTDTDRMLEPVRFRRRGGKCAAARGRTVAASGSVRVFQRGDHLRACRIGRAGPRIKVLPGSSAPQIVGDRWVLVHDEDTTYVVDSRTGRTVTSADSAGWSAILRAGTLAWQSDVDGPLLAQAPGSEPVVLTQSGSPPAAGRRVIYWTEGGAPKRYRP